MGQIVAVALVLLLAGVLAVKFVDQNGRAPAATMAAPAQENTNYRSVKLNRADNGHFEVEARVDGRRLEFIVDTGASHIALRESDAARLGIRPVPRDYTVKVDAGGLMPGATYYYAFDIDGAQSPIGRTKTFPASGATRMRFALVSCSNYPAGFFNVYASMAKRPDLDAIVHVGDYIYEFGEGEYGAGLEINRVPEPPREAVALSDYRLRYATYRTDPDLQEAHRLFPFIAVWDDHEICNDAWAGGAINHNPEKGEGDWATRKAAAYKAYLEWMPIRESTDPGIHLYRTFRFGGLADLVMIDTRGLRDKQLFNADGDALADPKRTLMGDLQEAWLFEQLRASQRANTPWTLLGQQVVFSPISLPGTRITNPDAWDGYPAQRTRVLDVLEREKLRSLVVMTGSTSSARCSSAAGSA